MWSAQGATVFVTVSSSRRRTEASKYSRGRAQRPFRTLSWVPKSLHPNFWQYELPPRSQSDRRLKEGHPWACPWSPSRPRAPDRLTRQFSLLSSLSTHGSTTLPCILRFQVVAPGLSAFRQSELRLRRMPFCSCCCRYGTATCPHG